MTTRTTTTRMMSRDKKMAMTWQSVNNWQQHGETTLSGSDMAKRWQLAMTTQAEQQKKKYLKINNKWTNSQICDCHEQIFKEKTINQWQQFWRVLWSLGAASFAGSWWTLGVSLWSCCSHGKKRWLFVKFCCPRPSAFLFLLNIGMAGFDVGHSSQPHDSLSCEWIDRDVTHLQYQQW